jgi:hypothetical protein
MGCTMHGTKYARSRHIVKARLLQAVAMMCGFMSKQAVGIVVDIASFHQLC